MTSAGWTVTRRSDAAGLSNGADDQEASPKAPSGKSMARVQLWMRFAPLRPSRDVPYDEHSGPSPPASGSMAASWWPGLQVSCGVQVRLTVTVSTPPLEHHSIATLSRSVYRP